MRMNFFHMYFNKWRNSMRINKRFLCQNKTWLNQEIKLPPCVYRSLPNLI